MSRRSWGFLAAGLLVALLLAGVVSNFASSHPDGLDSSLRQGCTVDAHDNITGGDCPAKHARKHELGDGPLANYGIRGIDNRFLANGLSGVIGVLLTFALGGGVFWLARRRAAASGLRSEATGVREGAGAAASGLRSEATREDVAISAARASERGNREDVAISAARASEPDNARPS